MTNLFSHIECNAFNIQPKDFTLDTNKACFYFDLTTNSLTELFQLVDTNTQIENLQIWYYNKQVEVNSQIGSGYLPEFMVSYKVFKHNLVFTKNTIILEVTGDRHVE